MPQMIRIAMPSFGTTTIALLQDTSLAFTIGVVDVVGRAKALGAYTFHTMEAYTGAALLFIVLSFILERIFAAIEAQMSFTAKHTITLPKLRMPQLIRFKSKASVPAIAQPVPATASVVVHGESR